MPAPVKKICLLLVLLGCCLTVFSVDSFANEENDYKKIELFTDVLSLIRSSYVEDVDMDQLIYGAIRGMLGTLDPHSSFLSPEMYRDMQEETHGEFSGLGIEIAVKNGSLIVVSPIEDTPAFLAGVKAGDEIVKINGQLTRDLDIVEATRMMRGPAGEEITISVKRANADQLIDFTIVRDIIRVQSVKSELLRDKYGYVRISQFQDRTSSDLKVHLKELHQQAETLNGVILDLRNNPGGLLDQAIGVADLFLDEGLIVYTEGRDVESQSRFSAQAEGTEPAYPLVVLIDGGSASAAEIVAGALQDHDRAIVLGEQSFGKGSVQTIVPLGDDSGLRLTTARYFTPSGRSIQALGIHPDIIVPARVIAPAADKRERLRERDLENHFKSVNEKKNSDKDSASKMSNDAVNGDNQLQRALDLLKGLKILQRQQQAA